MSDLTRFRDHAREMTERLHRPDCCRCEQTYCCGCIGHPAYHPDVRPPWWYGPAMLWTAHAETCPGNPAAPNCTGCVTDAERALWTQIADEIDDYLDDAEQEENLW